MDHSPTPNSNHCMDLGSCLKQMIKGGKFRRLEWEDEGTYITVRDAQVMIFKTDDNMVHPLIVSEGDILGEDWVKIEDSKS